MGKHKFKYQLTTDDWKTAVAIMDPILFIMEYSTCFSRKERKRVWTGPVLHRYSVTLAFRIWSEEAACLLGFDQADVIMKDVEIKV